MQEPSELKNIERGTQLNGCMLIVIWMTLVVGLILYFVLS